ncbi:hypothetical protein Bca52824_065948 [Brassica carinata]|uniref:Uncharacterized protein n=1 Tax=Brassica carinata TaxID=52824 RepID=A0A8X7QKL2_BRACI|nr:hypothetical protein Bca52824_065948 [Brassica carinata]
MSFSDENRGNQVAIMRRGWKDPVKDRGFGKLQRELKGGEDWAFSDLDSDLENKGCFCLRKLVVLKGCEDLFVYGKNKVLGMQSLQQIIRQGVVIHGSVDTKEKEMERRGYHGKGKEKMYEEPDSKWVKVGDRDNRRSSDGRGKHRGSEGGGQANLQETNSEARSTGSEEGELQMSHHEPINELPLEIGESTEATKEGKEIEKIENDLDLMNEVLGEEDGLLGENDLLDENEMDIDEQEARAFWDDITEDVANAEAENEDVGEDFQELTDEELEKEAEDKEDAGEQVAVDESETQIGRKEEGKNDGKRKKEKKPGAKKQLFKQGIAAGGTKKRLVQSLLSPRKRGVAKTASRQGGEEVKQVEERGPSNPNPSNTKP